MCKYLRTDDRERKCNEMEFSSYSRVPLYRGPTQRDIAYGTLVSEAELKSEFVFTTDTPYLGPQGCAMGCLLWGIWKTSTVFELRVKRNKHLENMVNGLQTQYQQIYFSLKKIDKHSCKFHRNIFLRVHLTIHLHWFMLWHRPGDNLLPEPTFTSSYEVCYLNISHSPHLSIKSEQQQHH